MSFIYYKFTSEKNSRKVQFDGVSLSAFDLKREIVLQDRLGKDAENFDLKIFNAQNGDEYREDFDMIPRNTTIKVARTTGYPGRNASRYLAGAQMLRRGVQVAAKDGVFGQVGGNSFQYGSRAQELVNNNNNYGAASLAGAQGPENTLITGETEEDKIRAVYSQTEQLWKEQSDSIAASQQRKGLVNQKRLQQAAMAANDKNSKNQAPNQQNQQQSSDNVSNAWASSKDPSGGKPVPPANYICDRCGIPGHYKQHCPTWGNAAFDNNKFKKNTGIPRSFLKTISVAPTNANAESVDHANLLNAAAMAGGSVMVTSTGEFVVAQMNDSMFKKHVEQMQSSFNVGSIEQIYEIIDDMESKGQVEMGTFKKPELLCKLCGKLLKEAVNISCCKSSFCDSCIRSNLQSQFQQSINKLALCPCCKKPTDLDKIIIDKPARAKIEQTIKQAVETYKKLKHQEQELSIEQQKQARLQKVAARITFDEDNQLDKLAKKLIIQTPNINLELPESFRNIPVIDTTESRIQQQQLPKPALYYKYYDLSRVQNPEINPDTEKPSCIIEITPTSLMARSKSSLSTSTSGGPRKRHDDYGSNDGRYKKPRKESPLHASSSSSRRDDYYDRRDDRRDYHRIEDRYDDYRRERRRDDDRGYGRSDYRRDRYDYDRRRY